MAKIQAGDDAHWLLNGIPHQRGQFDISGIGDYVELYSLTTNKTLTGRLLYSQYTDATDTPYATKQALIDDLKTFFFRSVAGGGGATTSDLVTNLSGVTGATVTNALDTLLASDSSTESVIINAKVNEAGGITKGQVVYISGATGGFPQVSIASNDDYTKSDVLAIAQETKTDGQNIIVVISGLLEDIDTSLFLEGDQLYLGTAGSLTKVHPGGIAAAQRVGHVVKVNVSTGSMLVEREPMTIIDDENLTLRYTLVNPNAGNDASASFTAVNDANHRASFSMISSAYTTIPEITDGLVVYNEGYGVSLSIVDGNFDHVWATDTTDSHNFTATEKMRLKADGELITQQQDIIHTSVVNDDHALEIECDAAGFGDVKAVDIDYITGAIAAGSDDAVILANIDKFASTGGDVTALEVLTTEGGATVNGMLCGVTVNPIEQLSGIFGDMDSALSNAVDVRTEFINPAINLQIFVNDNDTVTIGNALKFEELEFILSVDASQNIQPIFEYSTGVGTWATFTPVDGTNGMLNSGVIAWLDSDIPTWAIGTGSEFLIRITRTRNGLSIPPTEQKVQIAVAELFYWDKDGDLFVNNITANQINGGSPISKLEGLSTGFTTDLNGNTNYQKTITVTGAIVGDYVNAGLNDVFQIDLNSASQNHDIRAYVSATDTVIVNIRIDSFLAANSLRKVWVQIIK